VSEVTVDADGVRARSRQEAILDVLFDGRRILSFWLHRDGVREGRRWLFAWPKTLHEFLDGTADVRVVVTTTGQEVFRGEVAFGSARGRVEVVNRHGQPISLDKYLRRVVAFDTRSGEELEPMLDAIDEVLRALRDVGIEGFLAYGTLLGAVRGGKVIGNDSDADLGYVSHLTHPVDAIRESFRIQRELVALGYRITRYSALAFKVDVEEADGTIRGLDVFGGFLMHGHLYLMGEIGDPFQESWIYPLGTTTLEGRTFPAPADTDRLLTAMYGASWRVPDPAFHFAPPVTTVRRLNGWFRGLRVGRARWDRVYSRKQRPLAAEPSPFVAWAAEREPDAATYVDLGCGRGADVLWMAGRGVPSLGLDFQPRSYAEAAARDAPGADFWRCNFLELRDVLPAGAELARRPGPRLLVARHLVDTLGPDARQRLWRLARMALAGEDGGRLYLEFLARFGDDGYAKELHVKRRRPRMLVAELERAGATIVHRETMRMSDSPKPSKVARLVVEWRRDG
jgi:SAM-dependent methyltransferase